MRRRTYRVVRAAAVSELRSGMVGPNGSLQQNTWWRKAGMLTREPELTVNWDFFLDGSYKPEKEVCIGCKATDIQGTGFRGRIPFGHEKVRQ